MAPALTELPADVGGLVLDFLPRRHRHAARTACRATWFEWRLPLAVRVRIRSLPEAEPSGRFALVRVVELYRAKTVTARLPPGDAVTPAHVAAVRRLFPALERLVVWAGDLPAVAGVASVVPSPRFLRADGGELAWVAGDKMTVRVLHCIEAGDPTLRHPGLRRLVVRAEAQPMPTFLFPMMATLFGLRTGPPVVLDLDLREARPSGASDELAGLVGLLSAPRRCQVRALCLPQRLTRAQLGPVLDMLDRHHGGTLRALRLVVDTADLRAELHRRYQHVWDADFV